MHIPSKFKEKDLNTLCQLIEDYPLGTLITTEQGELDACHIPFYINRPESRKMTLQSHIARANSIWRDCQDGQKILLIFYGPNAYISPNFYPSKEVTGKAVPTWNYSVVHVRGRLYFKHSSEWILQLLENISDLQESASQEVPWSVADAPAVFISKLINAVVGLEVEIDDMIGNFKLSQNKDEHDYNGVLNGLKKSNREHERAVHHQMRNRVTHD